MNIKFWITSILILSLFFGCDKSKKAAQSTPIVAFEQRNLDTLVVSAPKKTIAVPKDEDYTLSPYHPSYTLRNDLIHTKLDLRFDWEKQHVLGKATLTLKPYFYSTKILSLDAKGFQIHSLTMQGSSKELKYAYDGGVLTIDLGQTYSADEEYTILMDYTAMPAETGGQGGSAAITSDQGLFFINHDKSDPNKPMQIWTQGETEWNSRWFPTIDKPNERCTQETYITVEDRFETLSNGLMVSSNKNNDGTRTDYWKMDQPHAPYLFMVAVGEFAVVKDNWEDIPVDYYVEPAFKDHAKDIFAHTPEMLGFFSKKLGVRYPWKKYAQIIVRDYVSGAMENTTSVIFGEFIQKTKRELIDDGNDAIVAHEMFHHWFGDFVTCESWANLTMNEGFANYAEYLWYEHKYGKDRADSHRRSELQGYVGSVSQGGAHPLIHFGHDDKEDMFDAHSYNKGGLVLHMLRNYVGDEAFFAGLKKYLTDNAYKAVESHNLRLAFEAVTGEDLNWFFNQWYFSAGHPILNINYDYDAAAGKIGVIIQQEQDPATNPPIFKLPFAIDVYIGTGVPIRYEVFMDQREQTFSFDVSEKPNLISVDAERTLLCEKRDNQRDEALIHQYRTGKNYQLRYDALQALGGSKNPAVPGVFESALDDKFWELRSKGLSLLEEKPTSGIMAKIAALAKNDSHSVVRSAALQKLADSGDKQYITIAKSLMDNDQSYRVIAAGLNTLYKLDPKEAESYAVKLESIENVQIINAIGDIYANSNNVSKLSFFQKNIKKVDGYSAVNYFESYFALLKLADKVTVTNNIVPLKDISTDMGQSPWRRFGAMKTLNDMRGFYLDLADKKEDELVKNELQSNAAAITRMIEEIKSRETNDQLKAIYNNF
ncbi:MAG: aminopeptidase N [Saprospiraceae bacterium]|jgi:aminopeptidase N